MQRLKLDDWTVIQRTRKWRWAREVALAPDEEWMSMMLRWEPYLDDKFNARRRQGRPKTRWTDDLVGYIHTISTDDNNEGYADGNRHNDNGDAATSPSKSDRLSWIELAKDALTWTTLEHGFSHRQSETTLVGIPMAE